MVVDTVLVSLAGLAFAAEPGAVDPPSSQDSVPAPAAVVPAPALPEGLHGEVDLIGRTLAAEPGTADWSPITPLPGETQAEADRWRAEINAVRIDMQGDPYAWSTSVRVLDEKNPQALQFDRATVWRATLGVDLPHPQVVQAHRRAGAAEIRALYWDRIGAARVRLHAECLSSFDIVMARGLAQALAEVLATATAAEQQVTAAAAAGTATRSEVLEAQAARLMAGIKHLEAQATVDSLLIGHRGSFGRDPIPVPSCDPAIADLPDDELVRRALAADPVVVAASCRNQAMAERTRRDAVAPWTWPASIQAITDMEQDSGQREWSFGVQASFRLTPKNDARIADAEQRLEEATGRIAAETVRQQVLLLLAEVRKTRQMLGAAEQARSSWVQLLEGAAEMAIADPTLQRRRDNLCIREAQARQDLQEKRGLHQRALLALTQMVQPASPPSQAP